MRIQRQLPNSRPRLISNPHTKKGPSRDHIGTAADPRRRSWTTSIHLQRSPRPPIGVRSVQRPRAEPNTRRPLAARASTDDEISLLSAPLSHLPNKGPPSAAIGTRHSAHTRSPPTRPMRKNHPESHSRRRAVTERSRNCHSRQNSSARFRAAAARDISCCCRAIRPRLVVRTKLRSVPIKTRGHAPAAGPLRQPTRRLRRYWTSYSARSTRTNARMRAQKSQPAPTRSQDCHATVTGSTGTQLLFERDATPSDALSCLRKACSAALLGSPPGAVGFVAPS